MHPLFRPTLLASLAVLAAAAPAASQRLLSLPRPQVYGGVLVGSQGLPDQLQASCVPKSFAAGEARAGVRSGALALEVRGALVRDFDEEICAYDFDTPDNDPPPPPPDGVHAERIYGFDHVTPTAAYDARLRLGATRAVPVSASVGVGRLAGPDVSYVLASLGVRTPGRLRFAAEVERSWYRIEVEDITREWRGGQPVSVVTRERHTDWWNGTGFRLGLEMDIF